MVQDLTINGVSDTIHVFNQQTELNMTFWQLQVSYLGQLQIIELEQDIEPTTQEILKEIRRVFDTKRLNHNQLHYMFC
jgi:hypothetical protein